MTGEILVLPIEDVTGMSCVSPVNRAKIENHHEALHTELNRKKP
jgi:hypothetical protein